MVTDVFYDVLGNCIDTLWPLEEAVATGVKLRSVSFFPVDSSDIQIVKIKTDASAVSAAS